MDEYPEVEFFLMIDDDEVAAPDWLSRMLGSASDTGADIVGGPVDRVFDRTPTRGIALHTLFNNVIAESGFVPSLYGSGNCLMRRSVFEKLGSPAFDLRFNFLGGGDMDFFTRARLKGFVSYWDNDARATETVPAARMTAQYVIRRSIATGVINYSIDRRRRPGLFGLALTLAKNLVGIPLAMSRAAALFVATRHWLPASYPLCVSLGRQLAAFGYDPAGYKAPVAAPSGASTAANPA